MNYNELFETTRGRQGDSRQYTQFMKDFPAYSQWLAGRFGELVDESKMTAQSLANLIGLDPAIISRSKSREHGYSLNLQSTKLLCYEVFHMSIHEFLSGEKPTVQVPKTLSLVVTALDRYADQTGYKAKLFRELREAQMEHAVKESGILPSATTDICSEVFGERMLEYCADRYISYVGAFGCSPEKTLQSTVRSAADTGKVGKMTIRLAKAIYVAIATEMPIDYFAVKDYTQYAFLKYENSIAWVREDRLKPVSDKTVIYILGTLLSIPMEERARYIPRILADTWVPSAATRKKKRI